jgi:hypothetical protein
MLAGPTVPAIPAWAGPPFPKEPIPSLPCGRKALLRVLVGRSWSMPQVEGAPRVPTVHPTASVGTRGNRQTRTRRNVRSGTAATPKAGEKFRGGILGDTTTVKSVGRPLIVTAALSQAARDKPPVEDPHEQSAELG